MSFARELRVKVAKQNKRDTLKSFGKVHSIKLNLFSEGMKIKFMRDRKLWVINFSMEKLSSLITLLRI